jgi:multiple sugar transport system ATP-binding protein
MAKIQFENVRKEFDGLTVIKDLSLTIEDGEFFTFVGPSGCGKSTLLNMVAGLETVTGGRICFDGSAVNGLSPGERDIAMVFQSYALYPHMTVYGNMAFPLRMKNAGRGFVDNEVKRVAGLLGLEGLLGRKPKELSGGQRQRVALGRAIIRKPKVFLMDEPLSNLDARLRIETRAELKKLHRQLKITTVYVTHDQGEAMSLSDRIAVLNRGEIQQCGTPLDVYEKPSNVFVGGFVGGSPMNFIKVAVERSRPFEVSRNGMSFTPQVETSPEADSVIMGIRPEDVRISGVREDRGIKVTVSLIEPAGAFDWVDVVWDGNVVKGTAEPGGGLEAGKDAYMVIQVKKMMVFDTHTGRRL